MKYFKLFFAIVAFLASSVFAVYGQEAKQEASPAATAGASENPVKEKRLVATIGADGVQHVEMLAGSYFFDPNYIIVKVNVPVALSVKKEKGYTPHNIIVQAPDAGIDFKIDLSDTQAKTITFTPTKTGKYEMKCDKRLLFFKSHKQRGMDGYIEVLE